VSFAIRVPIQVAVLSVTLPFGLLPIVPSVARAQTEVGADSDLTEVVVSARVQRLYRVAETTAGRLPAEPLASSQSIQVLNSELIADQGARTALDLYRNLSGVTFFSYAGVTARGFRQEEIFFDGLRGDTYASFSVPQLFDVERVEFLKGPAGMLYGPTAPGGVFNYTTKAPLEQFKADARIVVGTESRRGGSLDLNAPVGQRGSAVRVGAFYEDRDLPRFGAANETRIGYGVLRLPIGTSTLDLRGARYSQDLPANRLRGVPVDNFGNFLASIRWNHNEPTDLLRLQSDVTQLKWHGSVGESFRFDAGLRYNFASETQQYHEPIGLFDTNADGVVDTTRREYRDQIRDFKHWSFAANGIWSFSRAPVDYRVLAGIDHFDNDYSIYSRFARGTNIATAGRPTPLSLVAPLYGQSNPSTYVLSAFVRNTSDAIRDGAYLLGEATLGRWIATAGLRYDDFKDRANASPFSADALTSRLGLVYRLRDDISAYVQFADSFEPQSVSAQSPLAGGPFDPTEGEMVEAGLKWQLGGGRVQGTAAMYEIRRSNILQADPRGDVGRDGVNDLIAFGEVGSKGVEFDLSADITDNWVAMVSYAYNDTRITRSNGLTTITNSVGDRFANAPRNQFGFWTRYQYPAIGLALAFGGDYVDVRRSLSNQIVKPYFVSDFSLILERSTWQALLRVNNVFNEVYAASGFIDRTGHFPGAPREAFLELGRRW
jgi:iron complex outermembrane receptor protein